MSQAFGVYGSICAGIGLASLGEQVCDTFFRRIVPEQRTQRSVSALPSGQSLVDRLRCCREKEDDTAGLHDSAVFFLYRHSPTRGYYSARFLGEFTEDAGLDPSELVFAVLLEYLWDRFLHSVLDEVVHVHKRQTQQFCGPDSTE